MAPTEAMRTSLYGTNALMHSGRPMHRSLQLITLHGMVCAVQTAAFACCTGWVHAFDSFLRDIGLNFSLLSVLQRIAGLIDTIRWPKMVPFLYRPYALSLRVT